MGPGEGCCGEVQVNKIEGTDIGTIFISCIIGCTVWPSKLNAILVCNVMIGMILSTQ